MQDTRAVGTDGAGTEDAAPATLDPRPAALPERKRAHRGFAAMSPERQREIASLGGKAAHTQRKAHEWSPEEARAAGRSGGTAAQRAWRARNPDRA